MTPWTCADVGSFAWRTCTTRWPKIVRALADDVPRLRAALHALADEIAHGAVTLPAAARESGRFDVVDAFVGGPWTALPWYLGESFLYARIRAITGATPDPFFAIKRREEDDALASGIAGVVADTVDATGPLAQRVGVALLRCLWGNRADLSLPSANGHTDVGDHLLVVDDRAVAVDAVVDAAVVGVVLDNAGAELMHDLALAALLRRQGKRVVLFAKDVPFFVSDATPADVARTVGLLGVAGGLDDVVDIAAIADIVADPFFTGPAFLRTALMPPALVAALAACDVVVVKGDCNYRRLVGDTPPHAGPFADVVDFPAPAVCLRTLKAEVAVGVDDDRAAAARAVDVDWLTSGRFGLVQWAPRRRS
jgi:uncharacterized protein with ATP-grasp and redox domains